MLDVDTAQLITVVLAARSFLLAALLATCVVGLTFQIPASDFPIHITTPTLDVAGQVAFRTFTHVTRCFASMRIAYVRKQLCFSTLIQNQHTITRRKRPFFKYLLGWPHLRRFEQILSQVGTGSKQLSLFSVNGV